MKTAIEMLSDVKAYIAELEAENARLCKCLKEAIAEFCHACHDKRIENCREKCFVANWRDVVENGKGENSGERAEEVVAELVAYVSTRYPGDELDDGYIVECCNRITAALRKETSK